MSHLAGPAPLSFDQATKFYGAVIGVNRFSLEIGTGVTALLGANGAGKSTLIKLASGQLRPSTGSVRVGPLAAWSTGAKRSLGYCPDSLTMYPEMTGRGFVETMARLHGFRAAEARDRTGKTIDEVGMSAWADRRIATYSLGMRQRIKLAQALVHDPPLLLLDEPFSGVDPVGRREIQDTLRRAARGKTVVVSTHLLDDVDLLADRVAIIARGRLIAHGALAEIRDALVDRPSTVRIVTPRARFLAGRLAADEHTRSIEITNDELLAKTTRSDAFFELVGELARSQDLRISTLETIDAGAEAVFGYLA